MNELTTTEVKHSLTATIKVEMSPDGLREAALIIESTFRDYRVTSVYHSTSYGTLEVYLRKDLTRDIDATST